MLGNCGKQKPVQRSRAAFFMGALTGEPDATYKLSESRVFA